MFPALKLPALLLATSLVPGLHVPDLHVVTAPGTIVGFGDCDSVTGGPGAPKNTTVGDETSPFYWGRDGMNAFCMFQPQLTTHPVRITLVYPPNGKPDHWNVAWGQRDVPVIRLAVRRVHQRDSHRRRRQLRLKHAECVHPVTPPVEP